jgi:hypothetical protein
MSDNDNFIRNPNRKNEQERHITYQPEHVRLGIKPIKMERKLVPFVKSSKKDETEDFSSVDGVIFDDDGNEIKVEQGQVIDNNDYVFPPSPVSNKPRQQNPQEQSNMATEEQQSVQGSPKVGDYILMVSGKIIDTGSLELIEATARSILYGENESFHQEVKVDDIVVLKRVGINVGIFIDR